MRRAALLAGVSLLVLGTGIELTRLNILPKIDSSLVDKVQEQIIWGPDSPASVQGERIPHLRHCPPSHRECGLARHWPLPSATPNRQRKPSTRALRSLTTQPCLCRAVCWRHHRPAPLRPILPLQHHKRGQSPQGRQAGAGEAQEGLQSFFPPLCLGEWCPLAVCHCLLTLAHPWPPLPCATKFLITIRLII